MLFPPGTNVEQRPDFWVANRLNYNNANRNTFGLRPVGRLKPGVALVRAQEEVDVVSAHMTTILVGVTPTDPLTFAAMGVLFDCPRVVIAAGAACGEAGPDGSLEGKVMRPDSRSSSHDCWSGSSDTVISVVHSQEPSGCFRIRPM